MAFDIFYSGKDQQIINDNLFELFKTNTIVQRHNRQAPRKESSKTRSLWFQKRRKKHVF